MNRRAVVATLTCGALLTTAAWYTMANRRSEASVATDTVSLASGDRLLVRSTAPESFGHLATVELAHPAGRRLVSDVSCDRVYAAKGTAVCLRPDGPLATYQVAIMDADLHERARYPLVGVPNRARVSPSGHLIAWTVFVAGDSYNNGHFSTRVGMVNAVTGETVDTLEDFTVTRDGRPYQAADLNFWGVTYVDDQHFYATMSTSGRRYLVTGDVREHTVRTIAENVECPSLSPDGTRVAFKQAVGGDPTKGWRLSVLDLRTLAQTELAEARSVDDQAAWLDDSRVVYALRRTDRRRSDVWSVPSDGSGAPALLVPDAESPAALSR